VEENALEVGGDVGVEESADEKDGMSEGFGVGLHLLDGGVSLGGGKGKGGVGRFGGAAGGGEGCGNNE